MLAPPKPLVWITRYGSLGSNVSIVNSDCPILATADGPCESWSAVAHPSVPAYHSGFKSEFPLKADTGQRAIYVVPGCVRPALAAYRYPSTTITAEPSVRLNCICVCSGVNVHCVGSEAGFSTATADQSTL